MPSHLTRSIFRRLLANEPIVHRGCLRRRYHSSIVTVRSPLQLATIRGGSQAKWYAQRRHFFNFNVFGKKHEKQEATLDPGIEKMMELAKRQRMRARMPKIEDVSAALRQFFAAKEKQQQPMTDTQAQLVLLSLRHLLSTVDMSTDENASRVHDLDGATLATAARVVFRTQTVAEAHRDLAQVIYQRLSLLNDANRSFGLKAYVAMLCLVGSTARAHELVIQAEQEAGVGSETTGPHDLPFPDELADAEAPQRPTNSPCSHFLLRDMWRTVLEGYVKEKNDPLVKDTLAHLESRGYDGSRRVCATMIGHSLGRNDVDAMKHWWRRFRELTYSESYSNEAKDGELLQNILRWCLAKPELQTGHDIVKEAMTNNPSKPVWDAIFVWAAGTGKGVDEINRMIGIMEKMNEAISDERAWRLPDNGTINGLVDFAVSVRDPYMAERFITLGRERDIEPDARTFALQMDYRLTVGDVDGALIAYKALAEHRDTKYSEDIFTDDEIIINRLIVAMCRNQRHDFETIMNVTMDLADRKTRFDSETVSELALLHLRRDEHDDATDLLNTHAFQFSSGERAQVREAIINFALSPETPTSRAWDSYGIINEVFDETAREQRTQLMISFFERERADMGVRIFQQMRMHSRSDTIPTDDTYKSALISLAKLRDLESVEIIHNLLKLDFNITLTTYLRNALIIAYTACDRGRKALGFWDEIVASKEGPSYNSIHVALRACEKSPFGDIRAKELWDLLRRRNVELDQSLWASYGAALAGNGDVDTAITTIEDAEANGEVEVDAFLLGSIFAGAAGQVKQLEVELWAKENYPSPWAELEKLGVDTDVNEMRTFKIDR